MAGDVEEQQDLAADAAFDAGFSDEPSTVAPPVVDEGQAQPQTAEEAQQPVPEFVQLTKEEYERRAKSFPVVDYAKLMQYERADETELKKELACVAGTCEIF